MTHIANLTHLSIIKITGVDVKTLLQGQLTCNLDDISPQQSRLGAHCNPQGRIISLFRLLQQDEQTYYLCLPRTMVTVALAALKKYAVFYKVQLTDVSDIYHCIGVWGDTAHDSLASIMPVPQHVDEVTQTPECIATKLPAELPRYLLLANQPIALTAQTSVEAWQLLDIMAKLPAIYPETTEKLLPHDINLPALNAVSFDKGCYTGQEIIARMHYRGQLKKHLSLLKIAVNFKVLPGTIIYYAKENAPTSCGVVIDSAEQQVLAVVEDAQLKPEHLFLADAHNVYFKLHV